MVRYSASSYSSSVSPPSVRPSTTVARRTHVASLCGIASAARAAAPERPLHRALSPLPSTQVAKSKGPKVPESVLKKRKRQDKWDAEKKAAGVAAGKKAEEKKAEAFKRAEAYVKEFRDQEQQITTMKRAARKLGTFYVEPEPKLLFVMRLRGINGMHPKTRHIMKVLRLLQIHNGVFVQANKAVMNNLVKVDPYIMYGYPNLKTVKELIYKRGHAKIGKPPQRVPITDNAMIEDNLGEKTKGAVICIEDLIHQIYTVGPYFKECTKFLWPFKMNNPVGGFSRIRHHFVEGGDAGNREEYVNELIKRML